MLMPVYIGRILLGVVDCMRPMLSAVLWPRFSETARSGPRHRKAGRHGHDHTAIAVFSGSHPHDFMKRAAECSQAAEANIEANVRHISCGFAQQEHGALDSPALKVAVWSLTKSRLEGTDEVRLGDIGGLREIGNVKRLGICAVHRVARPEHPAIHVLRRHRHHPIFGLSADRGSPSRRLAAAGEGLTAKSLTLRLGRSKFGHPWQAFVSETSPSSPVPQSSA